MLNHVKAVVFLGGLRPNWFSTPWSLLRRGLEISKDMVVEALSGASTEDGRRMASLGSQLAPNKCWSYHGFTHSRCSMVLVYLPTKLAHKHGVFMLVNIPAPWFAYGMVSPMVS